MAKLTIQIEENEFALYDVTATFGDKVILKGENYTSEHAAVGEARQMAWLEWSTH